MNPFVSIIIPTFNVETKLEASLRSVLEAQMPFENFEVLIVDGASTDETVSIAREWAERETRIQIWSQGDSGIYDAMNRGIARSKGSYLYFLGAGDLLRPGVLEKVAMALEKESLKTAKPILLYGDIWWDDLKFVSGGPFSQWRITTTCPNHQTMFTAREIFDLKGGFDLKYPIAADYDFHIRCFGDSQIRTVHLPLVVADYEGGGKSSAARDEAFLRDLPRLVSRHFSLPVSVAYRMRRAMPKSIKSWGAPLMHKLGWMPDKRIAQAAETSPETLQ
ncbi:MAG TPA: glycosyltransferase family 2 protein [Abditibacterium sp.]|jgi:glycosyltransferase involved in cell wall biosynthesis